MSRVILIPPPLFLSDSIPHVLGPSFCLQVMQCIVEALADVLSRPRPLPVSQDCLVTLRSGRSPPDFSHVAFQVGVGPDSQFYQCLYW